MGKKKEPKESGLEHLGRFLKECKHGDLLFQSLMCSGNSDIVHVYIRGTKEGWEEDLKNELMDAEECIHEWFEYDRENFYMMMFGLERIKRKFAISFETDEDEPDMQEMIKQEIGNRGDYYDYRN